MDAPRSLLDDSEMVDFIDDLDDGMSTRRAAYFRLSSDDLVEHNTCRYKKVA